MQHVSHPCTFTQSYDETNLIYSETFSIALIKTPQNKRLKIKNLLIQGFYFKTVHSIDTPVCLAICSSDADPGKDIVPFIHDEGVTILADPCNGLYQTFTGVNKEILDVAPADLNPFRPHRFALYSVPEASYHLASAQRIINELNILSTLLTQGTTYSAPFDILLEGNNVSQYLILIPYIAGIKKTDLSASFRVNFDLEVL